MSLRALALVGVLGLLSVTGCNTSEFCRKEQHPAPSQGRLPQEVRGRGGLALREHRRTPSSGSTTTATSSTSTRATSTSEGRAYLTARSSTRIAARSGSRSSEASSHSNGQLAVPRELPLRKATGRLLHACRDLHIREARIETGADLL